MYKKDKYFESLSIEEISLEDRTFCLSYPLHDERLADSIRRIGIVQPLILKDPSPYVVIAGFKRLEAALSVCFDKIPCIIKEIDKKESVLIAINDNLSRGFNVVEKALCIDRMMKAGFSMSEVYGIMDMLRLEPHQTIVEKMQKLADAEPSFKDFLVKKRVSMKNITSLLWFEPEERQIIIDALSRFSLTESLLRELLALLSLIKLKEGSLSKGELADSKDPYDLRDRLKVRTNPRLTMLSDGLKQIKQRCSLPKNIDIKVDPFFEKEYIEILIKAKDQEEVDNALKKLERTLKEGYIRGIFELTKG